ncbi:DNA polymerase I [Microbacterium phage Cicada]|nr:DNA polymerase I [Microbacterium phage Cicada]
MGKQKCIYPSVLLRLWDARPELRPVEEVSIDTETSGLWVDAGARVSTVSVAWRVTDEQLRAWAEVLGGGEQHLWDSGIWTLRKEITAGARSNTWTKGGWVQEHWILSFAWPFDQGTVGTGKPEDPTDRIVEAGLGGMLGALAEVWTPDLPEAHPNLPEREWDDLLTWLQLVGELRGLTMHNAKFDIHLMHAGTRTYFGFIDLLPYVNWDTQGGNDLWIAWRTADFGKPTTSLKPTSQWLWGESEGDEKQVISKYLKKNKLPAGRWDLMPWPIIAKYADQDARLTCRLRIWQENEQARIRGSQGLDGPEKGWTAGYLPEAFERRMETMRMLVRVERRGVPFSPDMATQAIADLERRIAEVEAVLSEALGGVVTLPMIKHYWFGSGDKSGEGGKQVRGLGLEPYAYTDSGGPVVDIATLSKMSRDGYPLVEEWRAYKKLTDAKSRWYEGWGNRVGADNRLRPGFRQNGTASARFSMEEIQLQAIPADYKVKNVLAGIPSPRDLIGAGVPEGYGLWEMDLAQAELRVAAMMAKCQTMLDLIAAGEDLHGATAVELFGTHPGDPSWGSDRQVAKRGNFSLIFGVGAATFQATLWKEAEVDMPIEEVKDLIYKWNALYPEYRKAIDYHDSTVMGRYHKYGVGWIHDQATRERRHFTKWDVEFFDQQRQELRLGAHKAFNQRVQPALAHYGIDRWLAEEKYLEQKYRNTEHARVGAGLVLMVHDSSVLLLPDEDAEQVTSDLRDMGRALWAERFPGLPGDLDISAWAGHA